MKDKVKIKPPRENCKTKKEAKKKKRKENWRMLNNQLIKENFSRRREKAALMRDCWGMGRTRKGAVKEIIKIYIQGSQGLSLFLCV